MSIDLNVRHFPGPGDIILEETDTELLLYIHISEKERAKGIRGRRWDPDRRCWVYPKNEETYNEILSEFGDELDDRSSSLATQSPAYAKLKARHDELETDAALAREALEKAAEALKAAATQLAEEQARVQSLTKKVSDWQAVAKKLESENNRLASQLETAGKAAPTTSNLPALAKHAAATATGNDPAFESFLKKVKLDNHFPIQVAGELSNKIKGLLGNQSVTDLYTALLAAGKRNLLSPDALDAAHAIRKQRNVFAHPEDNEDIDRRSNVARIYYCLFAAALVWPELPE